MARGLRLTAPGVAWVGWALVLALSSLTAAALLGTGSAAGAVAWSWHAASPAEPWAWWSAALVHRSGAHLAANLGAAAAVAAWGWSARVGPDAAVAWFLAWPLSQALLITDPGSLRSYAGLSATLHAGVAIGCWHLLRHRTGPARWVGAAVSAALAIKTTWELPAFQAWVQGMAVTDLVAPGLPGAPGHVVAGHAHACGVAAGLLVSWARDGIMAARRPSP